MSTWLIMPFLWIGRIILTLFVALFGWMSGSYFAAVPRDGAPIYSIPFADGFAMTRRRR